MNPYILSFVRFTGSEYHHLSDFTEVRSRQPQPVARLFLGLHHCRHHLSCFCTLERKKSSRDDKADQLGSLAAGSRGGRD